MSKTINQLSILKSTNIENSDLKKLALHPFILFVVVSYDYTFSSIHKDCSFGHPRPVPKTTRSERVFLIKINMHRPLDLTLILCADSKALTSTD